MKQYINIYQARCSKGPQRTPLCCFYQAESTIKRPLCPNIQ